MLWQPLAYIARTFSLWNVCYLNLGLSLNMHDSNVAECTRCMYRFTSTYFHKTYICGRTYYKYKPLNLI